MKKLTNNLKASTTRVKVTIGGQVYEAANLLKSGITNRNIILVGNNEMWVEFDCLKLGISNDLKTFQNLVNSGKISPLDIGLEITSENEMPHEYHLKHDDYMRLEADFPGYPYYMIALLHKHITRYGRKSDYSDLKGFMKQVYASGKTIQDWIKDSENESVAFVEGLKPNEPIEHVITANDIIVKYCIYQRKINETEIVYLHSISMPWWSSGTSKGYSTIKEAEKQCLYTIMLEIDRAIKNDKNPEKYYDLFYKIQNTFKTISMTEKTKNRETQLAELGLAYTPKEDSFTGHGFTVTGNSIENDSDEDWQNTIERIEKYISSVKSAPEPTVPPAPLAPQHGGNVEERADELLKLGLKFDGDRSFTGKIGDTDVIVDISELQTASGRKWTSIMVEFSRLSKNKLPYISEVEASTESDPEPASTTSRAMSLTVIEGLDASKIKEFKNLEKETEKLIKANPVIEVTDKITLGKAKKNRAAMLKACTAIDGKEGLAEVTRKAFNTVKSAFDSFLKSAAEKRREHYEKQNQIIREWENAEALRIEEEQRKKLEKIKTRTDQLFSVPMTFNGTSYNLGTLYIIPSQIEELEDSEFAVLVLQAQEIKKQLDAEAAIQADKDAELAALRKRLAELEGKNTDPDTPVVPVPVAHIPNVPEAPIIPAQTVTQPIPAAAPSAPVKPTTNSVTYPYGTEYTEPVPGNNLLVKFDLENVTVVQANPIPPAFIKCRSYYIRGTKDVANAINDILIAPTQEGVRKSEQIAKLCSIIINQK